MKNIKRLMAMAAFVSVTATGCGSATEVSSSRPKPGTSQSSTESVADATDPYDAYLASDLLAINSALRELDYKCYADNGYPQYLEVLPAQKANDFKSTASTPDLKTTFASFSALPWFSSEESARKTGYGHSFPAMDPTIFATDPALVNVIKECRIATMEEVAGSEDLIGKYSQLGNTLSEAIIVAAKENRDTLTKKVFACMNEGKYPVDPNGPNKSGEWGVDFGVPVGSQPQPEFSAPPVGNSTQVLPAVPGKEYIPTAQESESAAAMFDCSVTTGARDEWLKAMEDAKNAALVENETTLAELNPAIKEMAKSAALALHSL